MTLPGRKQLRRWYCGRGLQQRQLAKLLGVSNGTVSQLCSGGYRPKLATALRIHALTGIALESWVDEAERKVVAAIQRAPVPHTTDCDGGTVVDGSYRRCSCHVRRPQP